MCVCVCFLANTLFITFLLPSSHHSAKLLFLLESKWCMPWTFWVKVSLSWPWNRPPRNSWAAMDIQQLAGPCVELLELGLWKLLLFCQFWRVLQPFLLRLQYYVLHIDWSNVHKSHWKTPSPRKNYLESKNIQVSRTSVVGTLIMQPFAPMNFYMKHSFRISLILQTLSQPKEKRYIKREGTTSTGM